MGNLTLLKFSLADCKYCEQMAEFDSAVADQMGFSFVNVDVNDAEIYGKYRQVLLHRFPLKREVKYPTYLLVKEPRGDSAVLGEIVGSCSREDFSERLDSFRTSSTS